MPENEILAEIRATREVIARESDYDVAKHFAHYREVTAKLESQGWRVAAPGAVVSDNVPEEADVFRVLREDAANAIVTHLRKSAKFWNRPRY